MGKMKIKETNDIVLINKFMWDCWEEVLSKSTETNELDMEGDSELHDGPS